MSESNGAGGDLLPLRRMAARLGVPSKWLRERAELAEVPALRAGDRWLFLPDVVGPIVSKMAAESPSVKTGGAE